MKKKKIWETITRLTFALMFVASWAVLGVALALKTAKIEIGGGITFTATDVYAKISGSVTGSKTANPINEHPIEIDASTSEDFTVDSSWTNMNLDFQNASTPIVVTITIENKSSERPFWVVISDNIEEYYSRIDESELIHNTDVSREIDNQTISGRYVSPIKLDKGKVTLKMTLNINDPNKSTTDDDFKLGIELIDESAIKDESEYTKLTFTTNDTYKTASVKASSTSIEGEVIIPAFISKNGEIYTVNEIGESGFINCSQMTSVSIPATIIHIQNAFENNFNCSYKMDAYTGWLYGTSGDHYWGAVLYPSSDYIGTYLTFNIYRNTPFNTSVVYYFATSNNYQYLKISTDGKSVTTIASETELELTLDSEQWSGSDATTVTFTSSGFNAYGEWEAIAEQTFGSNTVTNKFVKISDTQISCSVVGVVEGEPLVFTFTAI